MLLGNGDGTFQAAQNYSSGGNSATSIAVGDVNGYGKPDLLVGGSPGIFAVNRSEVFGVLLGNGDGTFQAAETVSAFGYVGPALALADFNGDGNLDVGADGVLFLGNGDGTFQSPLALGAIGQGMAVGDFNGDGKLDLAVGNGGYSWGFTILLNIVPGSTTTSLTSSPNPSGFEQPVTFTATVVPQFSDKVTGTITFNDGATPLGSAAVSGNSASLTTSGLAIGTHRITAVYGGDANFTGSTSTPLTQVVTKAKATTTTALVSSINPSVSGKPVSLTATVSSSAGIPAGKVEYLNGTTVLVTLRLTSGSVKYTTSKLPPGANNIMAVYEGDSNNNGSTSAPVNQFVIAKTTTTLTSSPNPSAYGQTVVFTATVTSSIGAPPNGETVTFEQGATVLGTGTLSGGSASFTTSTLKVGTTAVTAVYAGDANFASSTSKADIQVISKATTTTTLVSSLNPSKVGQSVTFTVSVTPQFSGTPTGAVVFKDGTTTLKTVSLSGGVAKFTTSKLTSGRHNIKATYNGSTSFTGSSASLTQTVN